MDMWFVSEKFAGNILQIAREFCLHTVKWFHVYQMIETSLWTIERKLTSNTIPGHCGPGSSGNTGVLHKILGNVMYTFQQDKFQKHFWIN